MNKGLLVTILVALTVTAAVAQAPTKDALIARAKLFELDTPYVPPPDDPLSPLTIETPEIVALRAPPSMWSTRSIPFPSMIVVAAPAPVMIVGPGA